MVSDNVNIKKKNIITIILLSLEKKLEVLTYIHVQYPKNVNLQKVSGFLNIFFIFLHFYSKCT